MFSKSFLWDSIETFSTLEHISLTILQLDDTLREGKRETERGKKETERKKRERQTERQR